MSTQPRAVMRGDGSAIVIRDVGDGLEELVVPAWAAKAIRHQATRCHCLTPCAGGCKTPSISVCALCINGLHDPNPARDYFEGRSQQALAHPEEERSSE